MEKKKQNVLLLIMGLLILFELVVTFVSISTTLPIATITSILTLVFVGLYGFVLYKKPHGNFLKYAMLINSVGNILSCAILIAAIPSLKVANMASLVASAFVCYCAGRLDKIEQNKILFVIIDVVYLVIAIVSTIIFAGTGYGNLMFYIRYFTAPIVFTTLMIAYFVRYKEHKEAGLTDK